VSYEDSPTSPGYSAIYRQQCTRFIVVPRFYLSLLIWLGQKRPADVVALSSLHDSVPSALQGLSVICS